MGPFRFPIKRKLKQRPRTTRHTDIAPHRHSKYYSFIIPHSPNHPHPENGDIIELAAAFNLNSLKTRPFIRKFPSSLFIPPSLAVPHPRIHRRARCRPLGLLREPLSLTAIPIPLPPLPADPRRRRVFDPVTRSTQYIEIVQLSI